MNKTLLLIESYKQMFTEIVDFDSNVGFEQGSDKRQKVDEILSAMDNKSFEFDGYDKRYADGWIAERINGLIKNGFDTTEIGETLAKFAYLVKFHSKELKSINLRDYIYNDLKKLTDEIYEKTYKYDSIKYKTRAKRENTKVEGYELVLETDIFKTYRVDTKEASIALGDDTDWCISRNDIRDPSKDNLWNDYLDYIHYFLIKKIQNHDDNYRKIVISLDRKTHCFVELNGDQTNENNLFDDEKTTNEDVLNYLKETDVKTFEYFNKTGPKTLNELINKYGGIDNYIKQWEDVLSVDSTKILRFPKEFVDKFGIDNYRNYWIKAVERNVIYIQNFPEEFIKEMGVETYIKKWEFLIRIVPTRIIKFPNNFIDKLGTNNYCEYWKNLLNDGSSIIYIEKFPHEFINNIGVDNYCEYWKKLLNNDNTISYIGKFPHEFINNIGVDNYCEYWKKLINIRKESIRLFPTDFIYEFGINNYVSIWISLVNDHGSYMNYFPDGAVNKIGINNYETILLNAIKKNQYHIGANGDKILNNIGLDNYIEFLNKIIKNDSILKYSISTFLRNHNLEISDNKIVKKQTNESKFEKLYKTIIC